MSFAWGAPLLSLGLLVGMLILLEAGRRIGIRSIAGSAEGDLGSIGAIEGAVLALFGLLLAFTVSGAGARFDGRRVLVVEETNAIGTAYLRLDMLPAPAQPALRDYFRRYVDTRLEVYRKLPDVAAARRELVTANMLQGEIWRLAIAGLPSLGKADVLGQLVLEQHLQADSAHRRLPEATFVKRWTSPASPATAIGWLSTAGYGGPPPRVTVG